MSYEFLLVDSYEETLFHPAYSPESGYELPGTISHALDLRHLNHIVFELEDETSWSVSGGDGAAGSFSASDQIEMDPILINWNPALRGKVPDFGGTILAKNDYFYFGEGNVTGGGRLGGSLRITYTSDIKTALEYALEIYNENSYIKDIQNPIERSREFYRQAIIKRERSYPGSSINENIRSVEYFGRGHSGSTLLRQGSSSDVDYTDLINEAPNALAPFSEPIYNALKKMGLISSDNEHAMSASGDTTDAADGWILGIQGIDLEEAIMIHFGTPEGTPPQVPEPTPPQVLPLLLGNGSEVVPVQVSTVLKSGMSVSSTNKEPLSDDVWEASFDASTLGASDFRVFVSGAEPSAIAVSQIGTSANFLIGIGTNIVQATNNQWVPITSGEHSAGIALEGFDPSAESLTIRLKLEGARWAAVAVVGMKVEPASKFIGDPRANFRLKINRTSAGVRVVGRGPSFLHSTLQESDDLVIWHDVEAFEFLDGYGAYDVAPSAAASGSFFRLKSD